MNKTMDDLLYDLGINLKENHISDMKIIINKLFNNDFSRVQLTCSSGLSIIILDKSNEEYVYQYYLSNHTYDKVLNNVLKLNDMCIHGFIKMYEHDDELRLIKYQKIVPIIDDAFDISKIKNDVFKVLIQMKKYNITHGDLTLDNIGFSPIENRYLIYDFETMNFNSEQDVDLYIFLKSINFRIGT